MLLLRGAQLQQLQRARSLRGMHTRPTRTTTTAAATTPAVRAAPPTAAAATAAAAAPKKIVLVVAAAILRRPSAATRSRAQVLLAQRPPGKSLAGLWEFPGGKVDASDASPEAALARELREELGLAVEESAASLSRLRPLAFASHSYPNFHLLMPLYALELDAEGRDGEPRGLEGQAVAWVDADELLAAGGGVGGSAGAGAGAGATYALPPADEPLVAPVCRALAALEGG